MKELVLVRHAPSQPEPGRPAAAWRPSSGAGERIRALAEQLAPLQVDLIVASAEPKAVATGRGLAACLAVPYTSAPRLHEHERGHVPLLEEHAWHDIVRRSFRHPDVLVFGRETANEARLRFGAALERALARADVERPAVVAHGTVMSLLVAGPNGLDPFELWCSLQMPEAWLLSWPDLALKERITAS
ncbi:MAG TPA: histidine phosphatase family protein [Trueperaceae bacterium]|nr:histidine phosphatase family protein [Trueperaceae bacterium]